MDELCDKIDLYILCKMSDDEKSAFETEMANDQELASDVGMRRLLMIGMRAKEAEELYWQEQSERIDSYLLHEMSDGELQDFENQLKWDVELRNLMETQRLIMTGIRLDAAQKSIDEIEEKLHRQILRRRNVRRFITTFAAAACVCLVIMTTGHFVGISYGSEAFNYVSRSADEVEDLVKERKYTDAIEMLENKIQTMESVLKDSPSIQNDIMLAKYELASVYLMDGEISKAKEVLASMEDSYRAPSKSPQVEKAEKLYDKLWWILW